MGRRDIHEERGNKKGSRWVGGDSKSTVMCLEPSKRALLSFQVDCKREARARAESIKMVFQSNCVQNGKIMRQNRQNEGIQGDFTEWCGYTPHSM